jgi:hypothetical protein
VGLAVCLWIDAYTDGRVVITSSTYEHVTSVLFAEVYKVDGPVLGDTVAGTAAIERGMAFAVAMCWAQRTLRSMLS